ncbi:MAG TPA: zinc ribbon domain-containing protein [Anaerolineae bacterium]|nr:zinc ribbon domain-containing protein [Anaerolineae bacterium]HOQ97505.1 zinc ribbon domain-containing protein [Anaerolineae bacterium]
MPTYEYECETCGIHFDRWQRMTDEPLKTCPECDGPVHRVLHPVGIVFKGSGWYCTDSRSGSPATLPPKEKAEDKPEAKGEKAEKKEAPTAEKKDS